jgi:hypothetical protein
MKDFKCRYAPSLGDLEDTPLNVWGIYPYAKLELNSNEDNPCVWFGLYGLPDFYSLWRHKGRKCILWAGSDIIHFQNGYWLEDGGAIKLDPTPLAEWINKHCESYVENEAEYQALLDMGITAKIVPSFMGNIDDYDITYKQNDRPRVYLSTGFEREIEYGFGVIEDIADLCNVDFYLYGSNDWTSKHSNVFVRGRVTKEEMNEEIKHFECGLRLNEFDGFSEITAKSILWGQYPITVIPHPEIDCARNKDELIKLLNGLHLKNSHNIKGREYYREHLNLYPWNARKH